VLQVSTVVGGPHQRFTLVYDSREVTPVYCADDRARARAGAIGELQERVAEYLPGSAPTSTRS
jgi:hypothetical protein